MRVVISAPRKSGGSQLRCLVAMAYDLKAPPVSAPANRSPSSIATWLVGLPQGSVSTCDLPHAVLSDAAERAGVHLIGVVRHPFDLFVSNFDVAQQRAARGRADEPAEVPWGVLAGEEISSQIVRDYATSRFADEVSALRDWSNSSGCVRFETLLTDPGAALVAQQDTLGPLDADQIDQAVGLCPADNVVASRPERGRRMPSLAPDAWRDRLPRPLLEVLQERYATDVLALGYAAV